MSFIADKTVLNTLLLRGMVDVHGTANCMLWNSSLFNVSLNSKMGSEEQGEETNACRELLGSLGCK